MVMITPPAALHAILFASGEPFDKKRLAAILGIKNEELKIVLEALDNILDGSGTVIIETETDVELRTSAEASAIVKKFRENEFARDLGKASMETLAVIAYEIGTTRADIDWVRGVNSSASIRILLMRGLIEGREDERDKRRIRYSLTTEALAYLGVSKSENMPRYAEFRFAVARTAKDAPQTIEEKII